MSPNKSQLLPIFQSQKLWQRMPNLCPQDTKHVYKNASYLGHIACLKTGLLRPQVSSHFSKLAARIFTLQLTTNIMKQFHIFLSIYTVKVRFPPVFHKLALITLIVAAVNSTDHQLHQVQRWVQIDALQASMALLLILNISSFASAQICRLCLLVWRGYKDILWLYESNSDSNICCKCLKQRHHWQGSHITDKEGILCKNMLHPRCGVNSSLVTLRAYSSCSCS